MLRPVPPYMTSPNVTTKLGRRRPRSENADYVSVDGVYEEPWPTSTTSLLHQYECAESLDLRLYRSPR